MRELKFLARRIKNMRIFPQDINGQTCTRKELIAVGLNDRNPARQVVTSDMKSPGMKSFIPGLSISERYSHSMVAGGLEEMS